MTMGMQTIYKPGTKVYEQIKERIILLDYKPGQVLTIKRLAQEFGVSSTPVREALIRLDVEGLVRLVPNSSAYVSEVSFQGLKDALEVRLVLVEQAGRLAAHRVRESDLATMKALIEKLEKESSRRELIHLDSALHEVLNCATGNLVLAKTLTLLRNQLLRLWFFIENQEAYLKRLLDDHRKLYEALQERDAKTCVQILRDHVLGFAELVQNELLRYNRF